MIKKSRKILTLLTLVLSVSLLLCALAILPHAEGEASLTPLENQSGVVAVTAIAGDQSSNTSEGYAKLTDGRNEGTGYTKWCTPFDTTNGAYVIL